MATLALRSQSRSEGGTFLRRLQGSLLFSPIIILVVLALFLWKFGQIREIVIRVVEPPLVPAPCGAQLALGFAAFAVLTAMIYFCYVSACVVLRQTGIGYGSSLVYGSDHELRQDRRIVWWRDGAALLCAGLPIAAVGAAFWSTSGVVSDARKLVGEKVSDSGVPTFGLCAPTDDLLPAQLAHVAVVWWALAGLLLLGLLAFTRLEYRAGGIVARRPRTKRHWILTVFAAAVLLLPIPLINLNPVAAEELFNSIGPLATLGLVLTSTTWLLFVIGEKSRRSGIPYFLIIVILVFVVGLYLWISRPEDLPPRVMPTDAEKARAAADLENEFATWLKNRRDKNAYTRPYPVYILSAPGGGIYAASFVASVVARLEATCPGFSQHVFAISAVSGGAIGSSMVDAIAHEEEQVPNVTCRKPLDDPPQVKLVKAMLSDDHLSPTMASTFPDVIAKLLLIGTYEMQRLARWAVSWFSTNLSDHFQPVRFDLKGRAEALETSLTESVGRACDQVIGNTQFELCRRLMPDGGALSLPYDKVWDSKKAAPALVLNTTWAETGERIAYAPFPLTGAGDETLTAMSELRAHHADAVDPNPETLIRAAVASARFPAVLPAMIQSGAAPPYYWWNFVDGGYADASGGTTALEIYKAIANKQESIEKAAGVRFDLKLLLLTESTTDPKTPSGPGLSHAISPITTLLTIREQIGRRAVARVINDLLPIKPEQTDLSGLAALDCGKNERSRMYSIVLNNTAISLPLGWMLSRHTANTIDRLVNFPEVVLASAGQVSDETRKVNLERHAKVNEHTFGAIQANLSNDCSQPAPAP